ERDALARKEQLPAVRMVVHMPDMDPRPIGVRRGLRRLAWIARPPQQIAVADCVVAAVKHLALPPEGEDSFGRAALVAGIGIDRPPALPRPADDLDLLVGETADDAPVALQALRRRLDERNLMEDERLCRDRCGS